MKGTKIIGDDGSTVIAPFPTASPRFEPLLTPAEVALMFRVDPKTVNRWALAGRLTSTRTLGGHRRYRRAKVLALLAGNPRSAASSDEPPPGAAPPPPDGPRDPLREPSGHHPTPHPNTRTTTAPDLRSRPGHRPYPSPLLMRTMRIGALLRHTTTGQPRTPSPEQ